MADAPPEFSPGGLSGLLRMKQRAAAAISYHWSREVRFEALETISGYKSLVKADEDLNVRRAKAYLQDCSICPSHGATLIAVYAIYDSQWPGVILKAAADILGRQNDLDSIARPSESKFWKGLLDSNYASAIDGDDDNNDDVVEVPAPETKAVMPVLAAKDEPGMYSEPGSRVIMRQASTAWAGALSQEVDTKEKKTVFSATKIFGTPLATPSGPVEVGVVPFSLGISKSAAGKSPFAAFIQPRALSFDAIPALELRPEATIEISRSLSVHSYPSSSSEALGSRPETAVLGPTLTRIDDKPFSSGGPPTSEPHSGPRKSLPSPFSMPHDDSTPRLVLEFSRTAPAEPVKKRARVEDEGLEVEKKRARLEPVDPVATDTIPESTAEEAVTNNSTGVANELKLPPMDTISSDIAEVTMENTSTGVAKEPKLLPTDPNSGDNAQSAAENNNTSMANKPEVLPTDTISRDKAESAVEKIDMRLADDPKLLPYYIGSGTFPYVAGYVKGTIRIIVGVLQQSPFPIVVAAPDFSTLKGPAIKYWVSPYDENLQGLNLPRKMHLSEAVNTWDIGFWEHFAGFSVEQLELALLDAVYRPEASWDEILSRALVRGKGRFGTVIKAVPSGKYFDQRAPVVRPATADSKVPLRGPLSSQWTEIEAAALTTVVYLDTYVRMRPELKHLVDEKTNCAAVAVLERAHQGLQEAGQWKALKSFPHLAFTDISEIISMFKATHTLSNADKRECETAEADEKTDSADAISAATLAIEDEGPPTAQPEQNPARQADDTESRTAFLDSLLEGLTGVASAIESLRKKITEHLKKS